MAETGPVTISIATPSASAAGDSTPANTGKIAAGAVGGVLVVVLIIAAALFLVLRKRGMRRG